MLRDFRYVELIKNIKDNSMLLKFNTDNTEKIVLQHQNN